MRRGGFYLKGHIMLHPNLDLHGVVKVEQETVCFDNFTNNLFRFYTEDGQSFTLNAMTSKFDFIPETINKGKRYITPAVAPVPPSETP